MSTIQMVGVLVGAGVAGQVGKKIEKQPLEVFY